MGKNQIAILGSSEDLADETQIRLATLCGEEIARRDLCLVVAGDDGVMGAAARAAKQKGGFTIAITPAQKKIKTPEIFDILIDTGLNWIQFSDVIVRSCKSAVIIGGGAGTLAEIAMLYLGEKPFAFLGSQSDLVRKFGDRPLDSRNLFVGHVFDDPAEVLDYVVRLSCSLNTNLESLFEQTWVDHCKCYPFGTSGNYLATGEGFQKISFLAAAQNDPELAIKAIAYSNDALGDHYYYHVEDYFRSAAHYQKALKALNDLPPEIETEFRQYLSAIIIESIGLGLENSGDLNMARQLYEEAAQRYEDAIKVSDPLNRKYLEHSATGIRGDVYKLKAIIELQSGNFKDSKDLLEKARSYYEKALQLHPEWAYGFSDNFTKCMDEINSLDAEISKGLTELRNDMS